MLLVPRTCVRQYDTEDERVAEPAPLNDTQALTAYVLLGDPGLGKSAAFSAVSERDWTEITHRLDEARNHAVYEQVKNGRAAIGTVTRAAETAEGLIRAEVVRDREAVSQFAA